ncbi:hypothetical protein ACIHCM_15495 [Streptomyces sp. NPDC052023]|uniref:hypothetical protein n=1 Tax=Streptomyces sp. NPDC052023 TaxID=3365681 RepID=UPI0037D1A593
MAPAPGGGGGDAALRGRSSADGGSSRHGDAYAVPLGQRMRVWLVPGTALRVEQCGTLDRYRDIPLFPG